MTEITATVNNRHYRLEVNNHADSHDACLAVSTLVFTLEEMAFNNDSAYCHYSTLEPGYALIEYIAGDELAEEDFIVILAGLMSVQRTYPDQITIEQNIFEIE